jgi:hypothetical protein
VIPVASDTLSLEQVREAQARRNMILRDDVVSVLGLVDDELSDLNGLAFCLRTVGGVTYLKFCIGDGVTGDTSVACTLKTLVQDVLAPSVPITGVNILHAALLADISVVIALTRLDN